MSDSSDNEDSDDFDPQEFLIVEELKRKEAEANGTAKPQKKHFFNKDGMESCLKQIALPEDYHWVETLAVTTAEPFVLDNLLDDLKRESMFYEDSLNGVKEAIAQFESAGIPYQRPPDFYAEMVKPDSHMARVKDSLLREKKKMAFVEARKQARDSKKMAKQNRAEMIKEKGAGKREAKATLEAIKAKRAQRNNSNMSVPRTTLSGSVKAAAEKGEKSKKRKAKDDKYGYGGKKRHGKANNSESLNDAKFPFTQNKSTGPNRKRIKASKGPKRPGKSARSKNRR